MDGNLFLFKHLLKILAKTGVIMFLLAINSLLCMRSGPTAFVGSKYLITLLTSVSVPGVRSLTEQYLVIHYHLLLKWTVL